ncbi:ribonuclease P protein component [Brachybacterium sp. EF45031]|uniref:ribonuclease P protein component n=1 Tax=Brachybacterium sillae TaxID=2810536 RepID=UPI00217DE23E|nr:ribonuclease P protein component [Brachybacterium sillae]MCS6711848.1 ribonuclease P protein component [Brachybacterium sillae]
MSWSDHRLRSSADFRVISRRGTRSARSHVVAHVALLEGSPAGPRVGFVVSTKVGNSVVRHRVTRRLREIVRANLDRLPPGSSAVLRARPGIDALPFEQLREQVVGALDSAVRKLPPS